MFSRNIGQHAWTGANEGCGEASSGERELNGNRPREKLKNFVRLNDGKFVPLSIRGIGDSCTISPDAKEFLVSSFLTSFPTSINDFRVRLHVLIGEGKIQASAHKVQFVQGDFRSHFTLRVRHWIQAFILKTGAV